MHLTDNFISLSFYSLPKGLKNLISGSAQIKIIDPIVDRLLNHAFDFFRRGFMEASAHTNSQYADLLIPVGQFPVFHFFSFLTHFTHEVRWLRQ